MSVPPTLEGFEVAAAVERMLDQPMLWWQAIGLFVVHFAGWERTWLDSVGDLEREQKNVHALRSAAANVGAMALSGVAASLEYQLLKCLAGNDESVPEQLRQHLLDSFRRTLQVATAAWESASPDSGRRE